MDLKTRQESVGELPNVMNDLSDGIGMHLDISDWEIVEQRIENMLQLFYPGYLKKLSAFEQYQGSGKKQIYYAGDYMSHALLGGACRSGEEVAQSIIAAYLV